MRLAGLRSKTWPLRGSRGGGAAVVLVGVLVLEICAAGVSSRCGVVRALHPWTARRPPRPVEHEQDVSGAASVS